MNAISVSGRVVLITGASSGIGAAIAVEFAHHGARLSLTGRDVNNLNHVADECWQQLTTTYANSAERPLTIVADVSIEDDVKGIVDKTLERFGCMDILVNNAGIIEYGTIETTSLEQFDRVIRTNLRAVFQLTMLSVPHLIATKGNIVNISSVWGTHSATNRLMYCMSKSALNQLTRCTALELAGKGVRVNGINPGLIRSAILRRAGLNETQITKAYEQASKTHPLGRVGNPEEVARAVVFLASDAASFVTGEQFHVAGGFQLCPRI